MPPLHRLSLLIGLVASADAGASGLAEADVGGMFGTAATTNPSAVWWNPAGLASARGTRFLADVGPSFDRLSVDRRGLATRPGLEAFSDTSVSPFVGLASDFGVKRIGVGFALLSPWGQRWSSDTPGGPNRYVARSTRLRTLQVALAGSYAFGRVLSVGVSAAVIDSRLEWTYDTPVLEELAADAPPGAFDDSMIDDPAYAATSTFAVEDQATTFGAGIYLRPLGDARLALSVGYLHGVTLDHRGTAALAFACPPESDVIGRTIAEAQGTCDTTARGLGRVQLRLPSRVNAGVVVRPTEGLRVELFGSWVGWSQDGPMRIGTELSPDAFGGEGAERVAERFTRDRPRARELRDTLSANLDAKLAATSQFTLGLRVGWQQAAVGPDALSVINADTDTLRIAGVGLYRPVRALEVGLSYGRELGRPREVTTSAFAASLEPDRPPAYRYVESRGRYGFVAQRVGFVVKGRLGPPRPRAARRGGPTGEARDPE